MESIVSTALGEITKSYRETRSILFPVLLCIVLTQLAWVAVYDCKTTKSIFLFDSQNHTLGNDMWDGLANAAGAMVVIAAVSGLMITLAIFHFRRIVEAWLALSCIVVSFVIAGTLFQDASLKLLAGIVDEKSQLSIAVGITVVYGGGAVMAFFTKHLPSWFHQLYVITNCASIATFYLTCLPGQTTWFLLTAVVAWDIFAVLAPIGPLKLALERSQDYGADILRFMMFTADSDDHSPASPSSSAEEPAALAAAAAAAAHTRPDHEEDYRAALAADPRKAAAVALFKQQCAADAEELRQGRLPLFDNLTPKRKAGGADTDCLTELLSGSEKGKDQDSVTDLERLVTEDGPGIASDAESDPGFEKVDLNLLDNMQSPRERRKEEQTKRRIKRAERSATESGQELNAREALNSGSHLGFGDFIFYSILVGKSMVSGLLYASVTTICILIGLMYTLSIKSESETLPALPISILFGMAGHFFVFAVNESVTLITSYLINNGVTLEDLIPL